jgi:hypothetical protein
MLGLTVESDQLALAQLESALSEWATVFGVPLIMEN